MDLEKLFEVIYDPSNYATESESIGLEAPLENTQRILFEKIYAECEKFKLASI